MSNGRNLDENVLGMKILFVKKIPRFIFSTSWKVFSSAFYIVCENLKVLIFLNLMHAFKLKYTEVVTYVTLKKIEHDRKIESK